MPPCDGAVTDLHDLHARGLNLNNIAIYVQLWKPDCLTHNNNNNDTVF